MRTAFSFFVVIVSLASCGGGSSAPVVPVRSPFLIAVDPKDHGRFDAIRNSGLGTQFQEQIQYLQSRGHDLQWYPNTIGEIVEHETVQMIYFDYSNYVVGWCTGALMSDNFVVSAGHCNEAIYGLSHAGAKCEYNLLFAYKPKKDGRVEYLRCDKVMASTNDSSEYTIGEQGQGPVEKVYHSNDYTIFRLANAAGNPPLRYQFKSSREWYEKNLSLSIGNVLLGLVVDPPSGNQTFESKYDIVLSEVVDGKKASTANSLAYSDGVYGQTFNNTFQPGNSGAPIYLIEKKPKIVSSSRSAFSDSRIFVGPHSGSFTAKRFHTFPAAYGFLREYLNIAEGR